MEEYVDDEILALKSIYEDELEISDEENSKEIRITLTPATADDEASKYVCLDICIKIPKSYPSSSPQFTVTRSRGLSDEYLKELNNKLQDLIEENNGNCVLFDILDSAREYLTDNNIPSDICSICLCGFRKSDDFLKTDCFHYFHRYCLKNYKDHVFENSVNGILSLIEDTDKLSVGKSTITVPCPVCKTLCEVSSDSITDPKPPENEEVVIDYELLEKQRRKFENLYRSQLEKGGVIDVEKEKNKFLLSNLQQNYDSYIASKQLDDANDNEASSSESLSCGKPTGNSQKFHNPIQGSRGRARARRNFTERRHHRNRNNHERFYANPQQHQPPRVETPCTSSESQNFPTKHENQTQTVVNNMHPPPAEHSLVKKHGGYHTMSNHDSKNPNPPRSNAAQSRGGGHARRRPYRSSWMNNNRRKDFSRSKMSNAKSLENSEL